MDRTGGAPRNSGDVFQLNSCHQEDEDGEGR